MIILRKKQHKYSSFKLKQYSENLSREDKIRIGKLRTEVAAIFAKQGKDTNSIMNNIKSRIKNIKFENTNNIFNKLYNYATNDLKLNIVYSDIENSNYNFERKQINLSKASDFVSLAHEIGHAINDLNPKTDIQKTISRLNNNIDFKKSSRDLTNLLTKIIAISGNSKINKDIRRIARNDNIIGYKEKDNEEFDFSKLKKLLLEKTVIITEEINASINAVELLNKFNLDKSILSLAKQKLDLMLLSYTFSLRSDIYLIISDLINIPSRSLKP